MAWVVDTCVLLDVLEDDPSYGATSARVLARKLDEGLVVCPVSYVELAPAFNGSTALEDEFLEGVGVDYREPWTFADSQKAHRAWARHIAKRRAKTAAKRPIADVLIGGFSDRFSGIITRNAGDFRILFPDLRILEP